MLPGGHSKEHSQGRELRVWAGRQTRLLQICSAIFGRQVEFYSKSPRKLEGDAIRLCF